MSYIAFFDLDETIIHIKSMFSFLEFYFRNIALYENKTFSIDYKIYKLKYSLEKLLGVNREKINENYYMNYEGASVIELNKLGEIWWKNIFKNGDIFNKKVINELNHHKNHGAEIYLVSGSLPACIEPIAKMICATGYISTEMEQVNGIYTGRIINGSNIGDGKRRRILELMKDYKKNINLKDCYAYGDHESDNPMLELVGNPVIVKNDPVLFNKAKQRNWQIIT